MCRQVVLELDETEEIQNLDTMNPQSDQCKGDEETQISTKSATSISQTSDISPLIVPLPHQ